MVDRLLANDKEVVEYVFFHRCDEMFAHIINSIFQSQVKKEELITDFFLYLSADDWRRLRQFGFRSELNTWMTVVAIRFFSEKKQLFMTKTEAKDTLLIETAHQIPDDYDSLEEMSKLELYEAIEHLPNRRERIALLGELAGKNTKMIAEELGCSVSAVYNLTKRARMALKKRMKGKDR